MIHVNWIETNPVLIILELILLFPLFLFCNEFFAEMKEYSNRKGKPILCNIIYIYILLRIATLDEWMSEWMRREGIRQYV